jgi:hypothetical protein
MSDQKSDTVNRKQIHHQEHLKRCPFCAGRAQLRIDQDKTDLRIQCEDCDLRTPSSQPENEEQLRAWWNRRKGSPSAFGGRATKGISTKRKRAASRRNLRRARVVAKSRRMAEKLQAMREVEEAEYQAEIAALPEPRRSRIIALEKAAQDAYG